MVPLVSDAVAVTVMSAPSVNVFWPLEVFKETTGGKDATVLEVAEDDEDVETTVDDVLYCNAPISQEEFPLFLPL